MTASQRRPSIFGPEPWATIASADWCHFDRWFALVAVASFDADLDQLEQELVGRLDTSLHTRPDDFAKLSHLADLWHRLTAAGIDVEVLATHEPADKTTTTKARRKVLDQALHGRAMTEPMRETPRVRLDRRARYGHWDRFPVNPGRWYEELAGPGTTDHVSANHSFDVTRRSREGLAHLDDSTAGPGDRLALYRAFQTFGVELAERGDDSFGVIGELRLEALRTYLGIDWAETSMMPEVYWQDLCELLVSEVFALTHQHETLPFRRVRPGQAGMIEQILLDLAAEWRTAHHDHQAGEALQHVAWLHIAGRRLTAYTDAARRLGSDHWQPVVALAESALRAGRQQLAIEVFRAADQPGWHRQHLRRRCFELTGERVNEQAPHLQVADQENEP